MKIRASLAALALCVLPASAQALDPGMTSFAFNIGWNIPEGKYADYVESGYTFSLDFTYNLNKNLAFRTEFGRAYNNVNGSKALNATNFSATAYNYNLTENAIYTFNPDAQTNFYVIAGVGGAKATIDVGSYQYYGTAYPPYWGYPYYGYPVYGYNSAVSQSTTRMTYNAGVGVQFKISPSFVMSLESRYTIIATQKNVEYIPIAVGFRFM